MAFNKRVTQSSTYNQFQANKAVDNNNKTESKTSSDVDKKNTGLPWLQIDLNDNYVVTGVVLLTKDGKGYKDTLKPLYLEHVDKWFLKIYSFK